MSTFSLHVHKLLLHDHWLISSHSLPDCEPVVVESGCRLVGWQLALAGPHWATRPHFSCRAATPAEPSPPRTLCAGTAGRAADGSNRLPDSCHKRSTTGISTLPTGGELVSADLAPSERLRTFLSSPTALSVFFQLDTFAHIVAIITD